LLEKILVEVAGAQKWRALQLRERLQSSWTKTQVLSLSLPALFVVLFYPVTQFVINDFRSEYLAILVLASLAGKATKRLPYAGLRFGRYEKYLLVAFFAIILVAVFSYFGSGMPKAGAKRLVKYAYFLFGIPVYFLFRRVQPNMLLVWYAINLGCFIGFGRAVLEEFGLVEDVVWRGHVGRANGVMHPIRFGDLMLMMAYLSLSGSLYLKQKLPFHVWIGLAGFLSGLMGSILSRSRGGWLAIPLLSLVVLWPKIRAIGLRKVLPTGALIVLLSVLLLSLTPLPSRMKEAGDDLSQYLSGNTNTPLGARFDMFKTGWHVFSLKPVFGVGVGMYHAYAKQYYDQSGGTLSEEVVLWKNPHNEFLLHLATRGVLGFSVLMGMYVSGLLAFSQQLRAGTEPGSRAFSAMSGLLVLLGFSVFGLSIALFEHRDFLMFFVIYLMLFLAGTHAEDPAEDRSPLEDMP